MMACRVNNSGVLARLLSKLKGHFVFCGYWTLRATLGSQAPLLGEIKLF